MNNSKFNKNLYEFNKYLINQEKNKTLIKTEGKHYIDRCLRKQNNTIVFQTDENILISSIIPVYNNEKNIFNSICSIQNQNHAKIEIILIDDCSRDNSYNIIKSLERSDKRIKIIKNKKNMGSLYSRSLGVLISQGEYIFPLDNDDMFFSEVIFTDILKIAKIYNFDIVGFRAFQTSNYNNPIEKIRDLFNYESYPEKIIVFQPKLSTWMLIRNGSYYKHDMTVWAKCIKTTIYKQGTNRLGIDRYSKYVSWAEDTIINFVIFNLAQSFIFIHKYGIIHLNDLSTATYTMPTSIKLFGELFLIDIIFDFSKNNSDKNYAVLASYEVKRTFQIKKYMNNSNLNYFKSILKKILNCQYITDTNKNKIKVDFETFFKQ